MEKSPAKQDPAALIDHARRCLAAGQAALATRSYRAALAHGARPATILDELGTALMISEQFDEAIKTFEQSVILGHNRAASIRNLALAMIQDGRSEKVIEMLSGWLDGNDTDLPAHLVLGTAHATKGDFDAAESSFRRCMERPDICGNAWQLLARIKKYESVDDTDVRAMKKLCTNSGMPSLQREKLHYGLAKALDDCGQYASAFAAAQTANDLKKSRIRSFDRQAHHMLTEKIASFDWSNWHPRCEIANPPVTPIFIFGLPRSGTTLIDRILQTHNRVASAGEFAFIQNQLLQSFWPFPERIKNSSDLGNLAQAYPKALVVRAENLPFITDKYPAHFLYTGLMNRLWPDAVYISVNRDPMDTGLSMFFQDFPDNQGQMCNLNNIGFFVNSYQQLMTIWKPLLGKRLLSISYEQLVSQPDEQSRLIYAHCGLNPDEVCREKSETGGTRTMSVWQARQPIHTESIGRHEKYKSFLQPLERALSTRS